MTFLSEAVAKLVGKAEEELSQRARELLARILLPDEITGAVAERYVKKALRTGAWRELRPESRALLMVSRAWKVIRSKFMKGILFSLFLEIELHTLRGRALFYGIFISLKRGMGTLGRALESIERLLAIGIFYLNNPPMYRAYG